MSGYASTAVELLTNRLNEPLLARYCAVDYRRVVTTREAAIPLCLPWIADLTLVPTVGKQLICDAVDHVFCLVIRWDEK